MRPQRARAAASAPASCLDAPGEGDGVGAARRRRRSARRPGARRSGGCALGQLLDPAVGVEEPRLQVQDRLADGREAEVARLDDPGVDRPDRDLDDLVALDVRR